MTETETPPKKIRKPRGSTKKSIPARGNRYTLSSDGSGDYRLVQIYTAENTEIPVGSLLPVPGVPGFLTKHGALRWINGNEHQLQGMYCAVVKITDMFRVDVQTIVKSTLVRKPRKRLPGNTSHKAVDIDNLMLGCDDE